MTSQPSDYLQRLCITFRLSPLPCQPVAEGPWVVAYVHEGWPWQVSEMTVKGVAGGLDLCHLARRFGVSTG